jgi:hypothetical protein
LFFRRYQCFSKKRDESASEPELRVMMREAIEKNVEAEVALLKGLMREGSEVRCV